MGDLISLRGVILSKYKTIGDFAVAVDWKRNKASRIVNGIQEPNIKDICVLTKTLNIQDQGTFIKIFFPLFVHIMDKQKRLRGISEWQNHLAN